MEVVKQNEHFVRELLGRVLHLLYKTLQERASKMPNADKGSGLASWHRAPCKPPRVACLCPRLVCCRTL